MLSAVRPLLNAQVEHWLAPGRDLFGNVVPNGNTRHAARVIETPGRVVSIAHGEKMTDAAGTIWLLDHPRPVAIGDTFTLPSGNSLKAVRVEMRTSGTSTLHKVYLS